MAVLIILCSVDIYDSLFYLCLSILHRIYIIQYSSYDFYPFQLLCL